MHTKLLQNVGESSLQENTTHQWDEKNNYLPHAMVK